MASASEIDEYYKVAVKLAQSAGEVIRKAIDEKKDVETKSSDIDLVTETDKKVEELLKAGFSSNFPDHW
ncbi:hypothetical protein AVEN_16256-1 [Araneus ventricosus]|uniref:Inositol monophosphatase 1 n=1 Tax=Araneus ventricosus TaxID=182803 RepID=A0A4Y2NZ71_ARAVE|nr:hypothetical protein AVEN_16256-1 [Araneus ventricosus]